MGQELVCLARYDGHVSEGRAMLETEEILFRGEFRLKIPFTTIVSLEIDDRDLVVEFDRGVARFELGPKAPAWIDKIRNPKSLIDKMGIKRGSAVALINVTDPAFLAAIDGLVVPARPADADVIVYQADRPNQLESIPGFGKTLGSNSALWVVTPRGTPGLKDVDIMAIARSDGLVDTKVVRFSGTHTALRFVPPRDRRGK